MHDRSTGVTERISFRRGFPSGGSGGDSLAPAISGDGCFVAFETEGFGAFVPDDTNGDADVHVADLGCGGAAPAAPGGSDPVGPADPIGAQPPATDPSGRPRDPVASPVRGTVRVRMPGSRRFVRLRRGTPLPAGSEIDTRRGVLRLAVGRSSALVSRGRAIVRGSTLTLTGRRLLVRSLSGRFRTRTRRAMTSGQRAAWLTVVRRNGTLITARRGRVAVRDLVRRRTVRLRAGERYRTRRSRSRTAPQ